MKNLDKNSALNNFIEANTCFEIVGQIVMCNVCTKAFNYISRTGVTPLKRHLNTSVHKKNVKLNTFQTHLNLPTVEGGELGSEFDLALLKALCSAQIPLSKLENPEFKNFLETYTSKSIKSESWFRKVLMNKVYNLEMKKKMEHLADKNIYLMFDETTDANGRYILHILVGECLENDRNRPLLCRTIELQRTTAVNINREILDFLYKLHGGSIKYEKIKLLISDQAPYALKVGRMLKDLIPSIKHVTCLAHLLHRLAEEIRANCPKVNHLCSEIKRLLIKNKQNQALFISETSIPLPKFPIITRWGTWIEFCCYIATYYNEIKKFAVALTEIENINPTFHDLFLDDTVTAELALVKKYKFIAQSTKYLEKCSLSTQEQISIVKEVFLKIDDEFLKIKLTKLMDKNPDISYFMNFSTITAPNRELIFSYVPLTTTYVEQSFSYYKNIFNDKRRSLNVESLEALIGFSFNTFN